MSHQITEHFALEELSASRTADALGIVNSIPDHCLDNLQRLCTQVLEPTRAHFGAPITITSGYRCPQLNSAMGGAPKSQHTTGEAVDFYCRAVAPMYAIWVWMKAYLPDYDQLIYTTDAATGKVWIHAAICKQGNRKQAFIVNKKTKTPCVK